LATLAFNVNLITNGYLYGILYVTNYYNSTNVVVSNSFYVTNITQITNVYNITNGSGGYATNTIANNNGMGTNVTLYGATNGATGLPLADMGITNGLASTNYAVTNTSFQVASLGTNASNNFVLNSHGYATNLTVQILTNSVGIFGTNKQKINFVTSNIWIIDGSGNSITTGRGIGTPGSQVELYDAAGDAVILSGGFFSVVNGTVFSGLGSGLTNAAGHGYVDSTIVSGLAPLASPGFSGGIGVTNTASYPSIVAAQEFPFALSPDYQALLWQWIDLLTGSYWNVSLLGSDAQFPNSLVFAPSSNPNNSLYFGQSGEFGAGVIGGDLTFQFDASGNLALAGGAGTITANASGLTNIPAAQLTGVLPAISGASLTGLTPGQSGSQPTNSNLTLLAAGNGSGLTSLPAAAVTGTLTNKISNMTAGIVDNIVIGQTGTGVPGFTFQVTNGTVGYLAVASAPGQLFTDAQESDMNFRAETGTIRFGGYYTGGSGASAFSIDTNTYTRLTNFASYVVASNGFTGNALSVTNAGTIYSITPTTTTTTFSIIGTNAAGSKFTNTIMQGTGNSSTYAWRLQTNGVDLLKVDTNGNITTIGSYTSSSTASNQFSGSVNVTGNLSAGSISTGGGATLSGFMQGLGLNRNANMDIAGGGYINDFSFFAGVVNANTFAVESQFAKSEILGPGYFVINNSTYPNAYTNVSFGLYLYTNSVAGLPVNGYSTGYGWQVLGTSNSMIVATNTGSFTISAGTYGWWGLTNNTNGIINFSGQITYCVTNLP
jgi:hypothetical protein